MKIQTLGTTEYPSMTGGLRTLSPGVNDAGEAVVTARADGYSSIAFTAHQARTFGEGLVRAAGDATRMAEQEKEREAFAKLVAVFPVGTAAEWDPHRSSCVIGCDPDGRFRYAYGTFGGDPFTPGVDFTNGDDIGAVTPERTALWLRLAGKARWGAVRRATAAGRQAERREREYDRMCHQQAQMMNQQMKGYLFGGGLR